MLALTLCFLLVPAGARSDESVSTATKEPPQDLAEPFRSLLEAQAVRLLENNEPLLEFWWRKEIPLQSKPASLSKALEAIPETTFLGAALVHKARRDYREDEIQPGLYTIRYGLRPDDGNHLGTSDYAFFVVLTPAKLDPTLDGLNTVKLLVKASRKETSSDHPVILSLRPVSSDQGPFPRLNEPAANHKSILLKVPGLAAGASESSSVIFDLVYEGVANL